MFESLLEVFDSWEPLIKARKAKGLAKWDKLSRIADKLKDKKSSDITFTTCYPGQEGKKKILGSVEGNLHFLMGYANPAFHVAAYHWLVIDPNISAEEAEELHKQKGHPSRPSLWDRTDLGDTEPEGDVIEGEPHPTVAEIQESARIKQKYASESVSFNSGFGSYVAIPSLGLVYGQHNKHVYKWEMVKNSFLAASNPKVVEAMNGIEEEEAAVEKSHLIPEQIANVALVSEFSEDVYPLVKSHFPSPGSVVPLEIATGESVYGVVSTDSISFYDREGYSVGVDVYDRRYSGFELTKGGDIHPSVLYNFAVGYLGLCKDELEQFVHSEIDSSINVVNLSILPNSCFHIIKQSSRNLFHCFKM